MAKLTFHLPNGEQLSFRLFTDKRLRIGRERGNDIVLRDARVSRAHAEVSFERGFFIVRDLGSSNGTYVNGREVKVAPLTEGCEVRIGSSVGRFSEELSNQPSPPTGPGRNYRDDEAYAAEPLPEPPAIDHDPYDDQPGSTKKHPKMQDPKWDYHREGGEPIDSPERPTEEVPDSEPRLPRIHDSARSESGELAQPPVRWTVERSDTGRSLVTGTDGRRFYFDAPWEAASLFGTFTALAMLIAGFGASIAFVGRGEPGAAVLVVGLTMVFVVTVMQLVPRRDVDLYEDESMSRLWIVLRQETRGSFPQLRYSARIADGRELARFRKSFWSNFGPRSWEVRDSRDELVLATLREETSLRMWSRKLLGAFSASLVTDFLIEVAGKAVGTVSRHADAIYRSILQVEPGTDLDPRSMAAMAVLLEVVERK